MRSSTTKSTLSKVYVFILMSALCLHPTALLGKGKERVTWSEKTINITIPSGGQTIKTLTFTSDQALENVVIEPVPAIARFVSVQPTSIANVPAGQPVTVTLSFSAAPTTAEGLYDGTIHIRRGAATIPEVLKVGVEIKNTTGTISNLITPQGGSISRPDVGTAVFPAGAFASNQLVTLSVTSSPETAQHFQESVSIFRVSQRLSYEIRLTTGTVRPLAPIQLTLNVPDAFLSLVPPASDIHLFAQIWEDGGEELLDNFELMDAEFDPVAKTVVATFPKEGFTNMRRADGVFESILTLGSTPGAPTTAPSKLPTQSPLGLVPFNLDDVPRQDTFLARVRTAADTGCQGSSLGSPLDIPLNERRAFNRAGETHPITGTTKAHYGTDLRAANGDTVRAMADGTIKETGFQFDPETETGWGHYIVLRHADGSATRYAHLLQGTLLPKDTLVQRGDPIAQADSSGGVTAPHLHVEYAPNGEIHDRASKVDPFPCIGANVSTSIMVGDNGTAADDAFDVFLDGLFLGRTTIGDTNSIGASNLRAGSHTLRIVAVVAPDDVATLGVSLSDGVTFTDGTTSRSTVLSLGGEVSYEIIVPSQ